MEKLQNIQNKNELKRAFTNKKFKYNVIKKIILNYFNFIKLTCFIEFAYKLSFAIKKKTPTLTQP